MKEYGLTKKEIISRKEEIKSLLQKRELVKKYPLLIYFIENNEPHHRIVVSVPKRNFKKAVDRNRIKRKMREIWRHNKSKVDSGSGKHFDLFIIYTGKEEISHSKLESKFILLLGEIN